MSRKQIYDEMQTTLGVVPTMFKSLPDFTLEHEWELFKRTQFDSGAVPSKYRELAGLAIAAVTKCRYCIFFHAEMAKLSGATNEEIEDILHFAKSTVGWSAYISGLQIDYEQFKSEVRTVCDHLRRHSGVREPIGEIPDYSEIGGYS